MTGIARLLEIASGAVGLTQNDAAFQALCGPGETPERARWLATLSTCALFLRGCLANAFLGWSDSALNVRPMPLASSRPSRVPPRLWAPYKVGNAVADLVAVHEGRAEGAGAPLEAKLSALRPGAIVIVGAPGHEHCYLVESIERDGWPDGSIELTTIEAGQRDVHGRQCVRRKFHEIDPAGNDRVLGRWASGIAYMRESEQTRPVSWVLDPRALLGDA